MTSDSELLEVVGRSLSPVRSDEGLVDDVRRLLDAGADPEARNDRGLSVLALAANFNRFEIVRLLIDAGADVNGASAFGPALMACVDTPGSESAEILLAAGADPELEDERGMTALRVCVYSADSDPALLRLLLDAGIDPLTPDPNGGLVMDYATPELRAVFQERFDTETGR